MTEFTFTAIISWQVIGEISPIAELYTGMHNVNTHRLVLYIIQISLICICMFFQWGSAGFKEGPCWTPQNWSNAEKTIRGRWGIDLVYFYSTFDIRHVMAIATTWWLRTFKSRMISYIHIMITFYVLHGEFCEGCIVLHVAALSPNPIGGTLPWRCLFWAPLIARCSTLPLLLGSHAGPTLRL